MLLIALIKERTCLCIVRACFIVALTGIASNSFAAAIGGLESITEPEPENSEELVSTSQRQPKVQLGFGTKISRVSVSDDIGQTNKINSTQSLSVYFTNILKENTRYLSEVYIANYAFTADASHLGQEVSDMGFRFSLLLNKPILESFSPWLGAGLDISNSSFKKRHDVDNDGFLIKEYQDESRPSLGVLINVMQKWQINSDIDIAAKVEYVLPITNSVGGASVGFIILFRPDSFLD